MTPPPAKPDKSAIDDAATDIGAAEAAESQPKGEGTRTVTGGRRRAASLELRAARRRSAKAAEGEGAAGREPATSSGSSSKSGRGAAKAGTRLRPRAQLRAARAARDEASQNAASAALPEASDGVAADQGAEAAQPANPVFVSVRRRLAQRNAAESLTATEGQPMPSAAPAAPLRLTDPDPESALPSLVPEAPQATVASPEMPTAPAPKTDLALARSVDVVLDEDDDDESGPGNGGRRRMTRAERRSERVGKGIDAGSYVVAPTVNPAQMRPRHYGVIALFLLCIVVPTVSYSWYLWTRAADQYESDVGFGSRTEEAPATFDFLGALGGTTQSGSKDMDILNQFIISQELVAKIDAELDLKAMYSKPADDPLYAFNPNGTIEDLVSYWQRMVLVNYDNATGLMNLRIFAFDPEDAQKIATAVLIESTAIINQLSKTAQEDTTRYSKEALTATEQKLAEARLAVLDFQVRNNIVDPSNVVANQLSVVATLNQQLAEAQIEFDMLAGTVPSTDLRLSLLSRRLEVIRNRIVEEQAKVGAAADSNSPGFAKLMADFEKLKVDQEFAQAAYLSALAAHDQALTDALQKTRYLAAYVTPTLAEAPTAPNRPLTAALTALIGFLIWSITVLTYYALRDRR